jgi:hypothetical protein
MLAGDRPAWPFQSVGPIETDPSWWYSARGQWFLAAGQREDPLFVLCSAMNYGAVKIILEKAISSPAEVELTELDEAIRWVEDRGTVRRLDRGADRDLYSSQFDAAAVEMRVLRRQLTSGEYAGATASAQRVLTLLGSWESYYSLPGGERVWIA